MTESAGRSFPWADDWPEIHSRRVRDAFTRVPRQAFVEPEYRQWSDRDAPLPIGEGQTISQPYVVALMTQALDLHPGEKVLEVGTGSGFQTAILCDITRDDRYTHGELVYSIERHAKLAARAVSRLAKLGYNPFIRTGDGAYGWPEAAPFAGIIVTAAARRLPRSLWEQLGDGGRLVIPIGGRYSEQTLWRFTKMKPSVQRTALGPVRFVPLVSPLLDDPDNCIDLDEL